MTVYQQHQGGENLSYKLSWQLFYVATFIVGYSFSHWLLDLYRWGDQEHYSRFWYAMTGSPQSEWSTIQSRYLGSTDLLYSYAIGFAVYFQLDRLSFLSAVNALMFVAIAVSLKRYEAGKIFWISTFTNYYFLVLISSAERLKFSYLFIILAFLVRAPLLKIILSASSIFFHTQAVVQIVSGAIYYLISNRDSIFSKKSNVIAAVVFGPIIIAMVGYGMYLFSGDTIAGKSEFYSNESQGIIEVLQWVLILLVGLVIFNKRIEFAASMLPMGFLTILYGNRINVATFALFSALVLINSKTRHPLVIAVMLYMSYKSIGFMGNVLETGQGF